MPTKAKSRHSSHNRSIEYDAALGRRAFEALASARASLGPSVSPAARLDMKSVAVLALGVARRIAEPATRARFRAIEAELPASTVDRLEDAAWGLWYAAVQRGNADATASGAMLPASLVEAAVALKARMLKVVEYHLAEDPVIAAKIADIVSGSGYVDLASDLSRLADLYEEHEDELRGDRRRYAAGDTALARQTAATIVRALGELGDATWADAVNRSYAVLDQTYGDIRPFALAMFRREGAEEAFPSVFSLRAAPRAARTTPPAQDGSDDVAPSEDAEA